MPNICKMNNYTIVCEENIKLNIINLQVHMLIRICSLVVS